MIKVVNRWKNVCLLLGALITVLILGAGVVLYKNKSEELRTVSNAEVDESEQVMIGGIPVGIYMETEGILVVDTAEIETVSGSRSTPAEHLVKAGDYILSVNGTSVSTKKELVQCVKNLQNADVVLEMRRDQEEISVNMEAVKNEDGQYQLGLWVRDDTQGLGTLTFVTRDGQYGSLGHGIHDSDTGGTMEISEGSLYDASILSVTKGTSGVPGGLEGMIVYSPSRLLGTIDKNTEIGIYGTLDLDKLDTEEELWVYPASKDEVEEGKAWIYCSVDGTVKKYEVEIEKINLWSQSSSKNFAIRVTDEDLIEKTGGIVQGMSGSPIVQNGKLIGAVTHVLVDNPTKGYGIFIGNMLQMCRNYTIDNS
jgi:stage IV sporulation protein B